MQIEENPNDPISALVSVARAHGVDLTVDALRSSYVVTDRSVPSQTVVAIARDAGLDAKIIHTKWRDLPRLTKILPAIIRLRDGGAAVLLSVLDIPDAGQIAVVEDPDGGPDGEVSLDEAHLNELWTGEIILIKRQYLLDDERKPFSFQWLLDEVLREKKLLREVGLASTLIAVLAMVPPFMMRIVIDRVFVNQSSQTLWVLAGMVGVLIVFETSLSFLKRLFTAVVTTRVDGRLNLFMMRRLLALPMEYFENNPVGQTMSNVSKIWEIREFLTGQLFTTALDMITLVVLLPVLFLLQWQLAVFVVVLAVLVFITTYIFLPPMGAQHGRVVQAQIAKGTYLTETVYGMRTIKSLALEGQRRHSWDILVAKSLNEHHKYESLHNIPVTIVMPLERLIFIGSFLLGAAMSLIDPDNFQPGALMAFSMLAGRTAAPLIGLANISKEMGRIQAAVGVASATLNYPPEETRIGTGLRLPVFGHILFQGVDFRYSATAPLALNGVSFEVQPGTICGIMGRSGSGKSTITRLLQGLNAKYDGMIKIDGMDLREIDIRHLRTNVGIVAQESFLFSGTVRENLGIGRPNATFPEIVRAAQLAGAEEFIERMPRGYDTYLQEGGSNLSGGQRQRLAIARALVVDPPVLLLDEATSALDAESEAIINANLLHIAQSRTILAVSHRLSMIVPADMILVMEKGKVYDSGTHEELLLRCDIYKHMWYTQNRHTASQPGTVNAPRTLTFS